MPEGDHTQQLRSMQKQLKQIIHQMACQKAEKDSDLFKQNLFEATTSEQEKYINMEAFDEDSQKNGKPAHFTKLEQYVLLVHNAIEFVINENGFTSVYDCKNSISTTMVNEISNHVVNGKVASDRYESDTTMAKAAQEELTGHLETLINGNNDTVADSIHDEDLDTLKNC